MEVETVTAVSLRGVKRTAEPVLSPHSKRARPSPPPLDDESASSPTHDGISTPSTPASIQPSRQKRLVCTWLNCTKTFSRPIHLSEHLNSHRGIRTYACEQCDKTFFRKSHLQHHVKNAHTAVRDYVCDWEGCNKAFSTGTRLRRHVAAHTKRQQYSCDRPGCTQSFRKHATLQRHIATEHEGRAAFVCDQPAVHDKENSAKDSVCGAGFPTESKLRAHQGRVHGISLYWCTLCSDTNGPLSFSTYTDFQAHNGEVHPPQCPECPYIAISSKDLRSHLLQQHDISDPTIAADVGPQLPARFQCDRTDCSKTFSRKANLFQHVKTAHEGRRFVCGEVPVVELNHVGVWDGSGACGRDFSAKSSLESHIRSSHLNIRNPSRRKMEKKKKPKKPHVSAAAQIAGTAYIEAARPLACLVTGCAFRFTRAYDRAVHARTQHGLGESDIAARAVAAAAAMAAEAVAVTARGRPKGLQRAKGTTKSAASSAKAPPAPAPAPPASSIADEDESDNDDNDSEASASNYEDELEQGAIDGGVFWVGGGNASRNKAKDEDKELNEWEAWEAAQMSMVVGGEDDREEEEEDDNDDDDRYDMALEDEDAYGYGYDEYGYGYAEDIEYGYGAPGSDVEDTITGTGGQVDMTLLG